MCDNTNILTLLLQIIGRNVNIVIIFLLTYYF
jgi:hypothetical protein